MLAHKAESAHPVTYEREPKERLKELHLVQSWKDQGLSLVVPLKKDATTTEWIPVTIEGEDLLTRGETPTRTSVRVQYQIPGTPEIVKETLKISDLIALQDRYFVDNISDLLKKILFTERPWLSEPDADNATTGSESYSVRESTDPPQENEIQDLVNDVTTHIREAFLQQNKNAKNIATLDEAVPPLLRTMNSWSHGFASPDENGIGYRTSAFPNWRDQDFAEVCRRAELALEAMQYAHLLQELILYGTEPKNLPPAVSPKTYGEVLGFLQDGIAKRLVPDTIPEGAARDSALALQARIALIDQWHARHAPLHLKLSPSDPDWIKGSWTDESTLKPHPQDPIKKGVAILYPVANQKTVASSLQQRWCELRTLIAHQDAFFLDKSLLLIADLRKTHPWLTKEARTDVEVSGERYSVLESDNPPSPSDLQALLAETALAYRRFAYADSGLTHRTDERGRRPEEPEIMHHWNAWSVGVEASAGRFSDYRYMYQTHWRNKDYAELCRRMIREIGATHTSVALQNTIRFGLATTTLPTAVSPEAFTNFLRELEQLSVPT